MQALIVANSANGRLAGVQDVLTRRGYEIIQVRDALQAERTVANGPVAMAVLDWSSVEEPEKLTQSLRLAGPRGQTPVLAVVDDQEREAAVGAGVSDFIARPATPASVDTRIAIVERWLGHLERRAAVENDGSPLRFPHSEEEFRTLMDASPDPIAIHRDRKLLYANQALADSLAYEHPRDLIGVSLVEFVHPADLAAVETRLRRIERTGEAMPVREERFVRRDGGLTVGEAHSFIIHLDDGPALLSLGRDVTETRELQSQLLHSERLSAAGVMAARVARELNSPLMRVLYNLSDLSRSLPQISDQVPPDTVSRLERRLHDMEEAVQHVREQARLLTELARAEEVATARVDLASVVPRALDLAEERLRSHPDTHVHVHLNEVPTIKANETRVLQLVLNLLMNAAEQLDRLINGARRQVRVQLFEQEHMVVLEVSDSGPGVPTEELEHALRHPEPQARIGLAVAHTIADSFGGSLRAMDAPEGTTLRVQFPIQTSSSRP